MFKPTAEDMLGSSARRAQRRLNTALALHEVFLSPKTLTLISLGILAFAMGAIGQYWYFDYPVAPSDFWLSLLGAFLAFLWYRFDSDQLGYRRSVWLNVGILAIGILAFPYYFFRSRGAKRGFIALGGFVLAVVSWGALSVAGQYVTWYGLQS